MIRVPPCTGRKLGSLLYTIEFAESLFFFLVVSPEKEVCLMYSFPP